MGYRFSNSCKNSTEPNRYCKKIYKEKWERPLMKNDEEATIQVLLQEDQERKQLEWTARIKFRLIIFDNEEHAKSRCLMKRVNRWWDQY